MRKMTITLALVSVAFAGCAHRDTVPAARTADPDQVRVYLPEPSLKAKKPGCQGTCQVEAPEVLSDAATDRLLAKVAAMPPGTESLELDTLLFHDKETLQRLDAKAVPVPAEWDAVLRRELARRDVLVTIRVVDETGAERARIDGNWEIGVRAHHLVEDVVGVPPFEASGTVVRVGREHLWVRM